MGGVTVEDSSSLPMPTLAVAIEPLGCVEELLRHQSGWKEKEEDLFHDGDHCINTAAMYSAGRSRIM